MSDKEEVIRKGKRAEQLQADPLLTECLEQIRQAQIEIFESSSPEKSEARNNAYFMLKAIEQLRLKLSAMASNGKFEAAQLAKRT